MDCKRGPWVAVFLVLAFSVGLAGCGSPGASCENDCEAGERRCSASENGYESCGDYDSDGCLEWGGLVACAADDTCSEGSCGTAQTGLVLTGELVPAGKTMRAGTLQLDGTIAKDFAREESRAGQLSLEHVGLTSKQQGD